MTHMVIFRSPEGKPGYHQAEGIDDAVRFTEMLRNHEQVTDARIFRMEEVAIEFRTYFRVEVATGTDAPDAQAPVAESGDAGQSSDAQPPLEPAAAAASAEGAPPSEGPPSANGGPGRFGLFTRG